MTEPINLRLRVRYAKLGRLRHLGHLEVLRSIDRSIRRSGLPYAITQGFSPHMKIQFSQALPVGASSECEWYDLRLRELVDKDEALERLRAATPHDLRPLECGYVSPSLAALESWLDHSEWRLSFKAEANQQSLESALKAVEAQGTIAYLRGDKPREIDLSETLESWSLESRDTTFYLHVITKLGPHGSLRPNVFFDAGLKAADIDPQSVLRAVEKLDQWHEESGSRSYPLESVAP